MVTGREVSGSASWPTVTWVIACSIKGSRSKSLGEKMPLSSPLAAGADGQRDLPASWLFLTLESPLDCKEIQPVHPKGNQS